MNRKAIERQKIRTMQMTLTITGGILILFGVSRQASMASLREGYQALWSGSPQSALEFFQEDLKSQQRMESHIGLILAHLELGDNQAAEKEWNYLQTPPENSGSSAPSRLLQWQSHKPRVSGRYQGELHLLQARLTGERLLRSYRRGDPQEVSDRFEADYDKAMERFRNFVEKREMDKREETSFYELGTWTKRYLQVQKLIREGQRMTDVELALNRMQSDTRNPRNEETSVLLDMLDLNLNRAIREAPERLAPHTWRLLVLSELARRDQRTRQGKKAYEVLNTYLAEKPSQFFNSESLPKKENLSESIRFQLAFGLACKTLMRHVPEEEEYLLEVKTKALLEAQKGLEELKSKSDERAWLLALYHEVANEAE